MKDIFLLFTLKLDSCFRNKLMDNINKSPAHERYNDISTKDTFLPIRNGTISLDVNIQDQLIKQSKLKE